MTPPKTVDRNSATNDTPASVAPILIPAKAATPTPTNVARLVGSIPRIDSADRLYCVHSGSTRTVSPMVGPFLSTCAVLRLRRSGPAEHAESEYLDHLLFALPRSQPPAIDQPALLALTAPPRRRARWVMRWAARRLHIR
jgi:hypothetical protein